MVGRASLQCFWVNPKVTDSFLPHSIFLWFFDYHRLTYLLPESSFCLCNFGLWLCSHFIWLKIALWQIHNIRFLRFTHQKNAQCPYKSCVDPGKQCMPSEGGRCPMFFPWASHFCLCPVIAFAYLPSPQNFENFAHLHFSYSIAHWMHQCDSRPQKVVSM